VRGPAAVGAPDLGRELQPMLGRVGREAVDNFGQDAPARGMSRV